MLLPHEIRKKEFSLAMGGYARSEVKSYLEYIADNYEKLRRENDELSRRLDAAMEKLDQYHVSEMAALTANVKPESEDADSEKTAAVAAILGGAVSSLQLELNMISARLREIDAIMSGVEFAEPVEKTEEPEEVEPAEEIEGIKPVDEIEDIEPIEQFDETDEIENLDEIEDEIEDLTVLDEAESELELLDEVEDEVEETDADEIEAADEVLVFEIPVSAFVPEEIIEEEIIEATPIEEEIAEEAPIDEASVEEILPSEETFEFIEFDEPAFEDAADDSEPEQIAFAIPEDTVEEAEDAPADEVPVEETDEQLDIDDFLSDFFDMDDAIDAATDGEDASAEFVEFIIPDEIETEASIEEAPVEITFDEPEADPIPVEAEETVETVETVETAPKKAAVKRFRIKKKKAAPAETEIFVEEAPVEVPEPMEEDLDQIIASLSETAATESVETKDADFVEAEPAVPETTEEEDLEVILRALKVQYDHVSAAANADDDDFDMTSFDEFNYIFGDSSSKIDTVPTEKDIDDVLYDE